MFHRLKEDLMLRGWDMLPIGIVRKCSRDIAFLPPQGLPGLAESNVNAAKL